ncbi:MAG: YodL domain-containing protein, partial [Proteiniphilum sp.]|nr:YodL domain-containing protein [Proteiniphilum sp.]MDD3908596.1 YodL domain-containing protein [Proteiniphilum sp.]MDD4415923.1 YodL domain-containing protein [Proteiniphilum sp.]
KELPELRASLETINKTASGLIEDIDKSLAVLKKEREKTQEQVIHAEPGQAAPNKMEEAVPPIGHEEMSHALETPEPPAAKPDGYPMPDPAISLAARDAYGYTDNDMLPLSKERAIELYKKDMTVYMLYEGNGAGMVFDRDDIDDHTGIFGVTREEWEETQDYLNGLEEKDSQQLENSFLSHSADAFAIYQLKDDDTTRGYRFEPLDRLQAAGLSVERGNYELIYTDLLPEEVKGDAYGRLNELFHRFNMEHPADFKGHSLSVSDIVALKVDGKVSAHYVDSWGFYELSGFVKLANYLEAAEKSTEQNYNQLDSLMNNQAPPPPTVAELEAQVKAGGQISLADLARAVNEERPRQRPSVMEQLKIAAVRTESVKTVPSKGAEMER